MLELYVVPDRFTVENLRALENINSHKCLHCNVKLGSAEDTWVLCPILKKKGYICYNSCYDILVISVANDSKEDPFFDEFEKFSLSQNRTAKQALLICLNHQLSVLEERKFYHCESFSKDGKVKIYNYDDAKDFLINKIKQVNDYNI